MRKFLSPKFWSLGTPLGYLGPVSQADPSEIFSQLHFLVIWTPNDFPELVASETQAENLKTTAAWCGIHFDFYSDAFVKKPFPLH